MKHIKLQSKSVRHLTSDTIRPLVDRELRASQGGFGGGLSRENFIVGAAKP